MKTWICLLLFISTNLFAQEAKSKEQEKKQPSKKIAILDGRVVFSLPHGFEIAFSHKDKKADGYIMTAYSKPKNNAQPTALQMRVFPTGKAATLDSIRKQIVPSIMPKFMEPKSLPDKKIEIAGLPGTQIEVEAKHNSRLLIAFFGKEKNFYWISVNGAGAKEELHAIYAQFMKSIHVKTSAKK